MNKKKTSVIFTIAMLFTLLGTLAFAPQAAYAQSGGGNGTLIADGDGLAGIRGNGTVTVSGNGVLWIRDTAGDAEINISGESGHRAEGERGWIRYSGFNGQAVVSGSQVTVAVSGFDIHLEASGTGKFIMRGNGSYSVERNGVTLVNGSWTEEAQVFSIP
jgi:hypothetical protein